MRLLLTILVLTSLCRAEDTGLLTDPTLQVDTLTLAEIAVVAKAQAELDRVLGDVAMAHGAHAAQPYVAGACQIVDLGSGGKPAITAAPRLMDDSVFVEVRVRIVGKYAYRTRKWPKDFCSNSIMDMGGRQ